MKKINTFNLHHISKTRKHLLSIAELSTSPQTQQPEKWKIEDIQQVQKAHKVQLLSGIRKTHNAHTCTKTQAETGRGRQSGNKRQIQCPKGLVPTRRTVNENLKISAIEGLTG